MPRCRSGKLSRYGDSMVRSRAGCGDCKRRFAAADSGGRVRLALRNPLDTGTHRRGSLSLGSVIRGGSEGDLADRISKHVRDQGGCITKRDLEEYRVIRRRPVRAPFCGEEYLSNPPPSAGGPG